MCVMLEEISTWKWIRQ